MMRALLSVTFLPLCALTSSSSCEGAQCFQLPSKAGARLSAMWDSEALDSSSWLAQTVAVRAAAGRVQQRLQDPASCGAAGVTFRTTHAFEYNASSIRVAVHCRDDGRRVSPPARTRVRLLHVADTHLCISNERAPYSSRMCSAFSSTRHEQSGVKTTPKQEFDEALSWACGEGTVDVVLIGGDLLNFPSVVGVQWTLELIRSKCGNRVPIVYTNGNHDWLLEGQAVVEASGRPYDWQREVYSNDALLPLLKMHCSTYACNKSGDESPFNWLQGSLDVNNAVRVVWIDNSNFQVSAGQLAYFQDELTREPVLPTVLLVHIPFHVGKADPRRPEDSCGHPQWGTAAGRTLASVERRPPWPQGNSPATLEFLKALNEFAAPNGPLVAVLSGHSHESLVCQRHGGNCSKAGWSGGSALEYTVGANAFGARSLVEIEI
eukprot:TRINITY_DN23479_c0_g1_i1.p1 TRINITY_DN23479_c0_g1~~TRINITY_DN23479_c0_g1_i1.p1  ORF type:complete len:472 (+),score=78.55 TRINITY_DN23479_c0_g1_i1:117-1418(+)